MKKIMMIAAMMVAALSANAQNEVGQVTLQPKVGMNIANLTGSDNKAKVGLVAGVEAEYGVAENFGITAGVLYSIEGSKSEKYNGKSVKFNTDYINVPIMAQYYVIPGLAVKAGAQFGFNVRKKFSYDGNSIDANEFFNDLDLDTKVQTFNFSIPVGVSYEYQSFVLDARYNIGMTKTLKNVDKNKTSLFSITLGYKFAL
jgi:hypothetical protein